MRKSLYLRPVRGCLLECLAYCIFLQTEVMGQGYVLTHKCDTTLGSQITLFGNYSSLPGDPVSWVRPDVNTAVLCQPEVDCVIGIPGYIASQSTSGLEYTLTIQEARDADFGRWTLQDGIIVLPITITKAVDLTKVNFTCSSGTQTGDNFRLAKGSPDSLTCGTECSSENIAISCYLEQDGNTTPFLRSTSSSCGSGLQKSSSTMVFAKHPNLSGNFSLCCNLTAGDCSYSQVKCKNLSIWSLTTTATSTTELTDATSVSTGMCSTDCTSNTVTVTQDSSFITSMSTNPSKVVRHKKKKDKTVLQTSPSTAYKGPALAPSSPSPKAVIAGVVTTVLVVVMAVIIITVLFRKRRLATSDGATTQSQGQRIPSSHQEMTENSSDARVYQTLNQSPPSHKVPVYVNSNLSPEYENTSTTTADNDSLDRAYEKLRTNPAPTLDTNRLYENTRVP